jgi:hypothetical protein
LDESVGNRPSRIEVVHKIDGRAELFDSSRDHHSAIEHRSRPNSELAETFERNAVQL